MMETPRALRRLLLLPLISALAAAPAAAAPADARAVVERFLQAQTAGLAGKARIEVNMPATLPACESLQAFLPRGAAPTGRVSVGLRCAGDRPWMRYVQARVAIEGRYFVAARAIEAGQALGAGDLAERTGDLGALPRSVVTDAAELKGVVAVNRIAAGAPVRRELLRGVVVIQQGQTVQVVAQGPGFTVSTEARAMTRAEAGATVQAKTRDGRLVSGVADEGGQILLSQ
ncbi:flagellar basal body P-ring formation chaperone FlgA [Variovorax sp. MHTC-1]|uniref:flagellar basal body P-ring formation chaperone FlgA n=1 Tax=Variovorax sp. MHTC-1 TaxID=2495593 RepID=UPI000F88621A|nr:flagellar basal body P-ring formation chaperone FlgA [Variovorax sp. MHTC-1]RST52314.1 flagellar basal body P-ring formation protein FlgA [Variovorax sp. MHTC-1]